MKHQFSKSQKINCPYCNGKSTFRLYEGFEGNTQFGRCERINSCGYFKSPNEQDKANYTKKENAFDEKDLEILYLDKNEVQKQINETTSNFHIFCAKKNIPFSHLHKWNVGSTGKQGEQTAFFFQNKSLNYCNKKIGLYSIEDGKRNKEFKFYSLKQPHALKSNPQPQKYTIPFFGEHQLANLDPTTRICIVESEKTAVIASFYAPTICFLACGSANGITDDKVKILSKLSNPIYWICDADKAGRENSSIDKLRTRKNTFIVDLFPNNNEGWDLADEFLINPNYNFVAQLIVATELKNEFTNAKNKKNNPNEDDIFWELEGARLKINATKFAKFLESKGFILYEKNGEYEPIFIKDKVIENTTIRYIKGFIRHYIENELPEVIIEETITKKNQDEFTIYKTSEDLLNKLMEGENTFVNKTRLGWAKTFSGVIQNDTKNTSFMYFQNGFLKIDREKNGDVDMDFLPYSKLENYIWKNDIKPYNFTLLEDENIQCDFERFIFNIAGKNKKNQQVFMQTIGYLLHTYKNPAFPVAIVWGDEGFNTSEKGGRGKSLIMQAIGRVREMVDVDGKKVDLNYAHLFDKLNENTKIFYFDDVSPKFDFTKLFSELTGSLSVNPKGKKTYKIPYGESPKFALSTNYVIEGDSPSMQRRKIELELAPHYTTKYTPANEFGRMFFSDWDNHEWNKFYNFMGRCLVEYFYSFTEGLPSIKPDNTNIALKKLLQETDKYQGFIDTNTGNPNIEPTSFADLYIKLDVEREKRHIFEEFLEIFTEHKDLLKLRTFTEMLKKYADFKGWKVIERVSGSKSFIKFVDRK